MGETIDADDRHNQGKFTDIYSPNDANPNGKVVTIQLRDFDSEAGAKFLGTSTQRAVRSAAMPSATSSG